MKRTQAVAITALVSGAALILASCSTKETPANSETSSATSSAAASGTESAASSGAAPSSANSKPGQDAVYNRPKVDPSGNITVSVEEAPTTTTTTPVPRTTSPTAWRPP